MFIDVVKILESFKNPVCDLYLKNGTKRFNCDIGINGDVDNLAIIENNVITVYPKDVVEKVEFYDNG